MTRLLSTFQLCLDPSSIIQYQPAKIPASITDLWHLKSLLSFHLWKLLASCAKGAK